MFRNRVIAIVAALVIGAAACGKSSPTAPEANKPAAANPNPVTVSATTQVSTDGFVTFKWQDVLPGTDVSWSVGAMTLIHADIKNTNPRALSLCPIAVENEHQVPSTDWRVAPVSALGNCADLVAGADVPRAVMGNYAQRVERVPWVRFVAWYGDDRAKGKPGMDTGIKFRLGWNMGQ